MTFGRNREVVLTENRNLNPKSSSFIYDTLSLIQGLTSTLTFITNTYSKSVTYDVIIKTKGKGQETEKERKKVTKKRFQAMAYARSYSRMIKLDTCFSPFFPASKPEVHKPSQTTILIRRECGRIRKSLNAKEPRNLGGFWKEKGKKKKTKARKH